MSHNAVSSMFEVVLQHTCVIMLMSIARNRKTMRVHKPRSCPATWIVLMLFR